MMRATQAHIHLDNLQHNINQIKKLLKPKTRLCIPVKADGYGHGATRVAIAAIRSGATFLAVASLEEALELREAGIVSPILSLSLPTPDEIPALIVHSITPLIFDEDFIVELGTAAQEMHRTIPVHLKIDTGMGRIGCNYTDAQRFATLIAEQKGLFLEGVCTHFAVSDSLEPSDIEYTKMQLSRFNQAIQAIRDKNIDPGLIHCANSGAVLLYPEAQFDMVRPGLILYGYFPDKHIEQHIKKLHHNSIDLKPVMELKTRVVSIKKVQKGEAISYGRTWCAAEDTWIATLPIGYADGLDRKLSPGLTVTINNKQYPVVGRICMDQCMVNLGSSHDVKRWDWVTVFGPSENNMTAAQVANLLDTIPYEVMCGVNRRVPRIYYENPVE